MLVCTWCAERFKRRADLDAHRLAEPQCARNATVSSPLQGRFNRADEIGNTPGEWVLNRVRAPTCTHEHTQPLVDEAGAVIGRQCSWCYSLFVLDLTE